MNALIFRCLKAISVSGLAVALSFSAAMAAPVTITVTTPQGTPLPDAVVYLMPNNGPETTDPSETQAEMVQRDTAFNPDVLAVQTGTSVSFPNQDPFRHHVYSFSDAKSFELKLYGRRDTPSVVFDQPGHVALGCNIHDAMLGHVYVVSTPFFGVSNEAGLVELPEVAEGGYSLSYWHPDMRGDGVSKSVEVSGQGFAESVEINVRRSRRQDDDFERFDY